MEFQKLLSFYKAALVDITSLNVQYVGIRPTLQEHGSSEQAKMGFRSVMRTQEGQLTI
jgi:hypothetical protein